MINFIIRLENINVNVLKKNKDFVPKNVLKIIGLLIKKDISVDFVIYLIKLSFFVTFLIKIFQRLC